MIKNKIVSTRLILSVGILLSVQLSHAVKLSIDNSIPINLSENVEYSTLDQVIDFKSSDPIICRNLSGSLSDLNADITDPNSDGIVLPLLDDVSYNIVSQTTKIKVNNANAACVTENNSTLNDIIFNSSFDQLGGALTFTYQDLPSQLVRGQALDYKINIQNDGLEVLTFDLIEYVSTNPLTNAAYFESVDVWDCISHNVAGVDCNEDNTVNRLLNAAIPPGQQATIDVARTVGSSAELGEPVDILTAMFIKNSQGQLISTEVISLNPVVIDNSAPFLSWVDNADTDFVEDQVQPQTLSFNVLDNTGANLTPGYLATVIGAVNDKLNIFNINVVENKPGDNTVSFDVTPKADQFTSSGNTEQIFVQLEDDFEASSNLLMLPITIEPINDAPSFTPECLDFTINPTPLSGQEEITCNISNGVNRGTWNYSNLISNISAGGLGNDTEDNQLVIFEVNPISGLAIQNPITIGADPGTFIQDDLTLILADGVSGAGSFSIRAIDNGVTDNCPAVSVNDNCNTSEYSQVIEFNILPPVYFLSGVVNGLPGQFDNIELNLYDSLVGGVQIGQAIVNGLVGGGSVDFDFISSPLLDGAEYRIEFTEPGCEFSVSGDPSGDQLSGVINAQNVDDIIINCGL